MLKVSTKQLAPDEVYEIVFRDDDPFRGRRVNQRLLVNKAGLKAIIDSATPVLEGHVQDLTVQELPR